MERTPLFDTKFIRAVHELEDAKDTDGLISFYNEAQDAQDRNYILQALSFAFNKTPLEVVAILDANKS